MNEMMILEFLCFSQNTKKCRYPRQTDTDRETETASTSEVSPP